MSEPARPRFRRVRIAVASFLTLVVAIVGLLQLPPVATWVARRLVRFVPLSPGYTLNVGRVSGDWFGGLVLQGVVLSRGDRELARIDRLGLRYRFNELTGTPVRVREIDVDGASATARRERDGWDLANALDKSADTTSGSGFAVGLIDVRNATLVAHLSPDSLVRVRGLAMRVRDFDLGRVVTARVERLNLALSPPASPTWFTVSTRGEASADLFTFDPVRIQTERSDLSGRVILPRRLHDTALLQRLDLRLKAAPLALGDIAQMVPSVATGGSLDFEARASAEGRVVTAQLDATVDQGTLALTGSTELARGTPTGYRVHGTMRRLDPSRLSSSSPAGSINGTMDGEVSGARDSASGTAEIHVVASRIGRTPIDKLDLHADLAAGRAEMKLRGRAGTGTLAVDGWVRPFDSLPGYRLAGSATRLPGTAAAARTLSGSESDSVLDVRFTLAGSGFAPDSARLAGRLDLAIPRGSGKPLSVGHATLSLEEGRLIARPDLTVGGGRITALATAHLGDTVTYRVSRGTIAGVDLGRLMGDTLVAPLNGTFSLSGSGTTPAEAIAAADFRLDQLRYGARRVDSVVAGFRLDRGRAKVALRGAAQGGHVAADLVARPFDSTAAFELTSAALDSVDLGTLLGRPDFAGPVSLHASGTGRWGAQVKRVNGEVEIGPSRLGHIVVTSGTLKAAIDRQRLTYETAVNTSSGALSLTGDGSPLAESPAYAVRQGRANSLDLGTLLGRAGLRSDLNATFTATFAGSGDSTEAGVDLLLLPSHVNDATLEGGKLTLALQRQSVNGEVTLEGPDGQVGAKVAGRIAPAATTVHTSGTLTLENLARWTGRKSADGRIEGRFAIDVAADSGGLRSMGGTARAIGGIGNVRLLGSTLVLTPLDGAIQVDTLAILSNVAQLDGGGTVALRDGAAPGLLKLSGRFTDVEPLSALFGADTVSLDSATLAMELRGPANHWEFEGQGQAASVLFAGGLAGEAGLKASGTFDTSGLGGVQGALRVRNAAFGKLPIPEIDIAARYDSLAALDASAAIGDSIRFATSVRGTVAGDTIRAVVQRLDLTESAREWSLERPANLEVGRRTKIDGLALVSDDRRITVNGVLDLKDSSDIALAIRRLDLGSFRSAGLAPIGGELDGDFHLLGRAADPTLQGKIGLAIAEPGGKTTGRVDADLLWRRSGLKLKAVAAPAAGGHLTIDGTLPYRLTLAPADTSQVYGVERGADDTLGINVRADSFNLTLFQPLLPPEVAKGLAGVLAADGRISGKLHAPDAEGTLALTGAALALPALGVSYEKGEIVGRLKGEKLLIDRLRLMTGKKQELDGQGVIHLSPLTDPGLALDATLKDFLISNSPTLRTMASGKLKVAGTINKPVITGGLNLGPTDVFVGAEAAAGRVEPVELSPEDMRRLARDFGPAVLSHGEESTTLMDRLSMDIQLRMPRRVWIRRTKSPEANIELSGQMRLQQKPGGDMEFVGKVEPVPGRGSLDLSGRTFRLTGGEINLDGPIDSTRLDVTAEYQVPTQGGGEDNGVVITVEAKGRLDSLGLEFSADPQMSQEDVLSYIITGHPASDNPLESAGQGLSGKQIAFGQLSQAVANTAGRQLGFDVFQITTDPSSGLSLTAGRYLSNRFFLNLKLPLGRGGSSGTPGDNLGPGFELEYSARRWLRADLRGGSLPPAILFRGRHAY